MGFGSFGREIPKKLIPVTPINPDQLPKQEKLKEKLVPIPGMEEYEAKRRAEAEAEAAAQGLIEAWESVAEAEAAAKKKAQEKSQG